MTNRNSQYHHESQLATRNNLSAETNPTAQGSSIPFQVDDKTRVDCTAYTRLPHSHCQFPGCHVSESLGELMINRRAGPGMTPDAIPDFNTREIVRTTATPWSIADHEVAITLCRSHRDAVFTRKFHVVRGSDDSLTFMKTT